MDQFRNKGEPPTFSSQPRGLSEYYQERTTPADGYGMQQNNYGMQQNGYGMQNAQGARPQSFGGGGGGGESYGYQQSQPQARQMPQTQMQPPQAQPPKQPEQWMVAMNGQQYGPYEPRLIEGMLTSRQIDPAQTYAWKQGMPNWVPFLQVPELAALAVPPAAAVAPPTPPMGGSAPAAPSAPLASSAPSAQAAGTGAASSAPRGASGMMSNTMSSAHSTQSRPSVQSAPPAGMSSQMGAPVQTSTPTQASASVDLNNATVEQLLTLPEFTLPMAEQLVAERGQRGGFQSVEQVAQFLNLKPHQADKLARTAVLNPFQGARPASSSSAPASGRVIDF